MFASLLLIVFALGQVGLALTVRLTLRPEPLLLNTNTVTAMLEFRTPPQFSSTTNGNQSGARGQHHQPFHVRCLIDFAETADPPAH